MIENVKDYVLECALAGDLEPLAYKVEQASLPLSNGEREFIAAHLRGAVKKSPHRPKQASPRYRWEALRILDIVLCEEMQGGTRTYAKELAARVCGLDKRTVDRRLALLLDGDEAERREQLERLIEVCDELDRSHPGRGDAVRRAQLERILSGAAYRENRVVTKTA